VEIEASIKKLEEAKGLLIRTDKIIDEVRHLLPWGSQELHWLNLARVGEDLSYNYVKGVLCALRAQKKKKEEVKNESGTY
jgi:hypothetical protein